MPVNFLMSASFDLIARFNNHAEDSLVIWPPKLKSTPDAVLARVDSLLDERKKLEKALLEDFYQRNGFVPEGNQKSFKP